ncbi:hypothetical protein Bca4012_102614 [Brassica carinata]
MIGRADIEGSKSNVAMNAWLPQASYPCDVPPQPNSPPDNVLIPDRPRRVLGLKEGVVTPPPIHGVIGLESSSTGSSFPADSAKPVPLAVVSLDSRQGHRIPLVRTSSELAVRRPGKAPERAVPSPSPGRHEAVRSRHVSGSSSPPTVDGFGTGTPEPSPQSQSFSRSYGSILPTSLAYIVPSTRGCSPWRPDAVMSTTGQKITLSGIPADVSDSLTLPPTATPRFRILTDPLKFAHKRYQTGFRLLGSTNPCASAAHMEPFPSSPSKFSFEYFLLPPTSAPTPLRRARASRFCSDRALLLIEAWLLPRRPVSAQLGTVTRLPVHPASPVRLPKMAHLELSIPWDGSTKQPPRPTYLKFENRSRTLRPDASNHWLYPIELASELQLSRGNFGGTSY